jgi:hypothetical protein
MVKLSIRQYLPCGIESEARFIDEILLVIIRVMMEAKAKLKGP